MKSKTKYWVTLIGLIMGGIAYWFQPYNQSTVLGISVLLIMIICAFLGSFFLMLFLIERPYEIALLVSLGVAIAVLARIIFDGIFRDPTSHNLAPFELIICGFVTIPAAFAGVYLGTLIKILFKK